MGEALSDAHRLQVARGIRGFAAGLLSIVLGGDLAAGGNPPLFVGAILGLSVGAGAAWTLAVPALERRGGRRALLRAESFALVVGGGAIWIGGGSWLLVLLGVAFGGISAGGADISPLGALEQAALAESSAEGRRTAEFARYNLVGYAGLALGLLAGASVAALGSLSGAFPAPGTHDLVFLVYAALGASLLIPYATLSVATEPPARTPLASPPPLRPAVRTLAALFALDAFAGGLIPNALVAYLFVLSFHATLEVVGFVLFLGTLGAAASLLFAEPLAARFGLVRTMVGSHLPSNVLLIAVAAAPDLGIAATLWISRSLLSQIDVPTRQALTQALVPAGQRAAAAGWTTAARSTQAAGAPVSGVLAGLGAGLVAVPFALAGAIKIVYDLIFYARFRSEEVRASDLLSSRGPTEDDAPVGSHR